MSKNYDVTIKWHTPEDPTTRETAVKTWASSPTLAEKIGLRGALLDGTIPADAIIDPMLPGNALDTISVDALETTTTEAGAGTPANPSDGEGDMPDIFPPGTRVIVQVSARKRRTGAVEYRVDATSCRVKFDGPNPSVLCRYNQLSLDDGSEPAQVPKKTERRKAEHQRADRKPSKSAELDAAAARGEMPAKPIITSKANQEQYQKRFDKLESWALAGDWDAVQNYEVKGINSYAKMVKQYRERLLTAHAASAERSSEAA